jgi:XTP/dITP diphosphohydrolase
LRTLTIEETYELADAISTNDINEIKKEIGDLFFHTIFYSKVASEQNQFDIADVINSLSKKLIYRHPHVFSDTKVENQNDVKQNWEELKLKENGGKKTVLGGIPNNLPAMIKAIRIQEKARGVGFDWDEKEQVWEKVFEEIKELSDEIKVKDISKTEKEFGDILFALINAARLYNINPENALELTNRKFISRFNYLENKTISRGLSLKEMTLEEMDVYWNEAKKFE